MTFNKGRNLTIPLRPIALAQSVIPTEPINKIQTRNAHAIVIKLFFKNGLSFFAFHIRFKLDSIALKILDEPHKNPNIPITAMTMEVCFIALIFFTISSRPIGTICFNIGRIFSIKPWDEPRMKNENERIPKIKGKRPKIAEFTKAEASNEQRSALNLLYALVKNQRKFFIFYFSISDESADYNL